MATLIRRSNGIYYLITKINGRRVWKSTGCTRKSGALKCVLKQERNDKKTSEPMTLRQFRKQLLAYVSANLAPTTAELYRAAITQFETLIGNFPLEDYSTQMVEKFKILRLGEVSPVKVNIDFRTLRAAFNIAVNWGLLSENPFRRCKQIRVPAKRPVYLTQD